MCNFEGTVRLPAGPFKPACYALSVSQGPNFYLLFLQLTTSAHNLYFNVSYKINLNFDKTS